MWDLNKVVHNFSLFICIVAKKTRCFWAEFAISKYATLRFVKIVYHKVIDWSKQNVNFGKPFVYMSTPSKKAGTSTKTSPCPFRGGTQNVLTCVPNTKHTKRSELYKIGC